MWRIECIRAISEAKKWWEHFSPNVTLYDAWDFRHCFHERLNYDIFFYVGYTGEQPVGLLAMQYNSRRQCYEPFGGSYMYDVSVFIAPGYENYIPKFYETLPQPTKIIDITGEDIFTASLPVSSHKYLLNLESFSSVHDYLEKKMVSKYRTNIKRRVKLTEQTGVTVEHNQLADLDLMIELNLRTFHDSNFQKPFRREIFHDLIEKYAFGTEMLTFSLNGVKQAVSLSFNYNGRYYYINLGIDKTASPHLWTYVTFKNIERAIELGCKTFDAGIGDYGWKEHWGFTKFPEHTFLNFEPATLATPSLTI